MKQLQIIAMLFITLLLSDCSVVKKMAGADIDPVQFAKAREAKICQVRLNAQSNLYSKLSKGGLEESDITIYLTQDMLNQIVQQYEKANGWFDASTSYIINKVNLKLLNGCALVSLDMIVHNNSWGVEVAMTMDCLLTIESDSKELKVKLEPFNISPQVSTGILLSGTAEIIENLVKINLGGVSKGLPAINLPMNFANSINISETFIKIRNQINMQILNPRRKVNYNLKIRDILLFEGKAFIALNLENVEVK